MASFTYFTLFPPEIQSLILDKCSPNDQVCLRLTSKYFYNLPTNKKITIHLEHEEDEEYCGSYEADPKLSIHVARMLHRRECHEKTYHKVVEMRKAAGKAIPALKKCRTRSWSVHCECFNRSSKLYQRLRTWVPKGLNYCGQCAKFTRRKASQKKICYHGRGKPRKQQTNFWTHRRGQGGFDRMLWKKWVRNSEMDQFERRLRDENVQRKGTERYALRKWVPRDVDTREMR
ncbi:hypothetical protein BP5796_08814 [Coleophoma crateriformis]|uniref:F-box domain-containing protein n=1 Tax=Coleophoma crateriformis TaxID=565419 RepID=A0A3D8R8N6_9HELO|nr:hypothetical protein BP5796_08814 [Coleophoma crateriformis]